MFGLISTLAEILSAYWGRFLAGRRLGRDADVAHHLVRVVVALQGLCVRGERLLVLAERLLAGDESPEKSAEYAALVGDQALAVEDLRALLEESTTLLATVDARFYLDLAPLIDRKSGLLARWNRQAELSRFSTTTLFFLAAPDLARLIDAGRASAGPDGLDVQRGGYVAAVADSVRAVRAGEVRDISRAAKAARERARDEIASARADLRHAGDSCAQLMETIERALGPDAMARLRRQLLPPEFD